MIFLFTHRCRDKAFVRFVLSENPSQWDLDEFLSVWDIEAEGAEKSFRLAIFKIKHPELSFPRYAGPRLDGLVRYFRFKQTSLLLELNPFLSAMAAKHIPVVAMGDLAFNLLFKDTPHSIFCINVAVPRKCLSAARKVASGNIYVEAGDDLFFEGSSESPSGMHILLPGKEVLFYAALYKLGRMLEGVPSSSLNVPGVVLDVCSLLNSPIDYDVVIALAGKEHTLPVLHSAVLAYNDLVTSDCQMDDFTLPFLSEKEWDGYCLIREYNAKILSPARQLRHAYPMSRLVREPRRLFSWLGVRMQFKIIKNVRCRWAMKTLIAKYEIHQ